jgi:hypothetical protein
MEPILHFATVEISLEIPPAHLAQEDGRQGIETILVDWPNPIASENWWPRYRLPVVDGVYTGSTLAWSLYLAQLISVALRSCHQPVSRMERC